MNIYVTRHGQTEWNKIRKVMGRCDKPLNDVGKEQAKETRDQLLDKDIDLIICSPLTRAKQTAEIINENRNIPIIYDERIIERDFGSFEGFNVKELDNHELWDYYKNDNYEGTENIQELFKRIYNFLDDIIPKYHGKNILLVTHGGVSIPVYCYFNKVIPEGSLIYANISLKNCEVSVYKVE